MIASEQCRICGKRGKRSCPATGGLICPSCCGSHRGSKLSCPPQCDFFPFGTANYDLWQEINQSWAAKSMRYLDEHLGSKTMAEVFQRFLPVGRRRREDALVAYFPSIYHGLFVHRDPAGKTMAAHWEAQSWVGLNNDEKVMMQSRRQSYVTVIEVQRTVDADNIECLDLLEPGSKPFKVLDRATAASVTRFSKMLVWLTHYPFFSRIAAIRIAIPELLWPAWLAYTQQQFQDEQKTRPELTHKQYLAEHMWENEMLLQALADQSRKRMLESIGVHDCVGEFRLTAAMEAVKGILDQKPDFRAERPKPTAGFETPPHFYVWQPKGESEGLEKTLPEVLQRADAQALCLGQLRLYPDRLLLEAFSKPIYQSGKVLLEKFLGQQVQLAKESIVDMARQREQRDALWPKEQEPRPELVGASLAPSQAQRQAAWDAHNTRYQKLLDEPLPNLNGLTPRAASREPAVRPKLVEWLKVHIHHMDIFNRQHGLDLDLNGFLDELGVPELKG